jgi:formylglycine-generating enzyme required for sulfatase activity
MKILSLLLFLMLFGNIGPALANNVVISNVSILNSGPGHMQVQFDLSWDNSWRTATGPANYDGVWVFFKFFQAGNSWQHMNLTGTNNFLPAGFSVYQDTFGTGAMIYRNAGNSGYGPVTLTGVKLGINAALPSNIDVKGFALEMVYIPGVNAGGVFFGDGDGVTESLNSIHILDNRAAKKDIISFGDFFVDPNSFDDNYTTSTFPGAGIFIELNDTITATSLTAINNISHPFPTTKPLWCMKYEISQAGYRDFLNTLTLTQQITRTTNSPLGAGAFTGLPAFPTTTNLYRNYIEVKTLPTGGLPAVYGCDGNGNNIWDEGNDGEWVACNFLSWPDVAAYLDWSGLAPMSEIGFEHICRGHSATTAQPAHLGEYAWGNTNVFASPYTLTYSSTDSELAGNTSVASPNANYVTTAVASLDGPLRSGIFATPTSNRYISGSSYFGVMDMSGNVSEYVITIGNIAGRSVLYLPNGDGTLSASGNAHLPVGGAGFWPGMEGNNAAGTANACSGGCEVTGNAGIVFKGGSFADPAIEMSISRRNYSQPSGRDYRRGGRGVLYIR